MEKQKEYVAWAVIRDQPKPVISDRGNFMPFEIAVQQAIKYISSLSDTMYWKEVTPKPFEAMRWENVNGDKLVIVEILKP